MWYHTCLIMKLKLACLVSAVSIALVVFETAAQENPARQGNYVMVVHGGAGTILKRNMTARQEEAYTAALTRALQEGHRMIQDGRSALDAVEAAIRILEDSPLFNAGKGAVFTHEGRNELDASVMEGKDLSAGAVAGVRTVRNPISVARAVMEQTPHVMLSGEGADRFAREAGLETVDPEYFRTERRWEALQKLLEKEEAGDSGAQPDHGRGKPDGKFGTVGAVALDKQGNLAAGTSTGGMTNKKFGRIGDSPVIGAGTYADNRTAAVSCTGWGEFFIRTAVAHQVSALMAYKGVPVTEAGREAIEEVARLGGSGGLIALDREGNIAMPFNTEGMYRGAVTAEGEVEIYIYRP